MAVVPKDDTLTVVERPELPPGQCIASMITEDPKGFVDTLLTPPLVDPRVYISITYIEDVARKLGMEYVKEGEVAALKERVKDLEAELAEADHRLDAIDVMESAGFVARKKPGPKKKATKAKA